MLCRYCSWQFPKFLGLIRRQGADPETIVRLQTYSQLNVGPISHIHFCRRNNLVFSVYPSAVSFLVCDSLVHFGSGWYTPRSYTYGQPEHVNTTPGI